MLMSKGTSKIMHEGQKPISLFTYLNGKYHANHERVDLKHPMPWYLHRYFCHKSILYHTSSKMGRYLNFYSMTFILYNEQSQNYSDQVIHLFYL